MKLMLVCTSGGHFSTMRSLKSFWELHERVWVTDRKKDTESLMGDEEVFWMPYQAPRNVMTLLLNLPRIFYLLLQQKPDMVVSTGASIAIGTAMLAKLLGIKFVFIESISRSQELSLSGKIVYRVSDEFYVQWPTLVEKYPKALYRGYV